MYHYKVCGLDNIHLKNGYTETDSPSGKGIAIHNVDGLHKAIARGIAKKEYPITPKEFKFLRVELDLSQKAIGKLMGKTDQMIAKWEKGTPSIPVLADKAIRDMYMVSIGEGQIAGILEKLADLDRQFHEFALNMEETNEGWDIELKDAS